MHFFKILDFRRRKKLSEKSFIFPYVLPLKKNFDQNFFKFFFDPFKVLNKKFGLTFPLFSPLKKSNFFFPEIFLKAKKAIFPYVLPLKKKFDQKIFLIFLTLKKPIFRIFCLWNFFTKFFSSHFCPSTPKKYSSNAFHLPKSAYTEIKIFYADLWREIFDFPLSSQ